MRITPDLAAALLAEVNDHPWQLPLEPEKAAAFAERMRDGTFTASPGITFSLVGGRIRPKNGQHRLAAVAAYGRPVEMDLQLISESIA